MTVRPDKNSRVTRVRSPSSSISARTSGAPSGAAALSTIGHLHVRPARLYLTPIRGRAAPFFKRTMREDGGIALR